VLGVPAPSLGCGTGDGEATRSVAGRSLARRPAWDYAGCKVTITDKQIVLDCCAELVETVLLSYAAVEALVNERIESLDGSVRAKQANARGIEVELGKAEMACRMSTGEKLDTAIPLVTGESSIKGTTFLERFVCLRRIRGAQACSPRLRCNAAHLAAPEDRS
jgi:hypothetical protein